MITVIASFLDLHATAIVWSLESSGAPSQLIETFFGVDQEFGGFSVDPRAPDIDGQCAAVHLGPSFKNQRLSYFRCDYSPRVLMEEDDEDFLFVRRERALHQKWLLEVSALEGNELLVNSPCSAIRADNKMLQLKAACAVGLSPPKTYFGSSMDRAKELFLGTDALVIKPLEPFTWHYSDGRTKCAFAARASCHLIDGYKAGEVLSAPAIFQEEIIKAFDVRAFVFGDQVHAFKISQNTGRLDSREDLTNSKVTKIEPFDLPNNVRQRIGRLMEYMRIDVACMDIVPDQNGEFHFLDLNPSGNWLFLESSFPESNILSKFCVYLAHRAGVTLLREPPGYAEFKESTTFEVLQKRIGTLAAQFSVKQRTDQWVEQP